jgi:hypothetical protein
MKVRVVGRGIPNVQAAEESDAGRMTTQLGISKGRYDEHSSKFFLSKKLRFVDLVGKS